MKYLGIDYGTRRIGVAVSDDSATFAFPLGTVLAGPKAFAEVMELARENSVALAVMGESNDYNGKPNPVMEEAHAFARELEGAGLAVHFEPEFMTSAQAARQYEGDHGRGARPNQDGLDSAAAAIILQSYLDRYKKRG